MSIAKGVMELSDLCLGTDSYLSFNKINYVSIYYLNTLDQVIRQISNIHHIGLGCIICDDNWLQVISCAWWLGG
mgnify:CR=1 FL=1